MARNNDDNWIMGDDILGLISSLIDGKIERRDERERDSFLARIR